MKTNLIFNRVGDSLDEKVINRIVDQIERSLSTIVKKRVSLANFKSELSILVESSILNEENDSEYGINKYIGTKYNTEFHLEFAKLYPTTTTNSSWRGISSNISKNLTVLRNIVKDAKNGNTHNYHYRMVQSI
jgi:hypothetical protein